MLSPWYNPLAGRGPLSRSFFEIALFFSNKQLLSALMSVQPGVAFDNVSLVKFPYLVGSSMGFFSTERIQSGTFSLTISRLLEPF